jgi:methyl-accepting chemotaxis protein
MQTPFLGIRQRLLLLGLVPAALILGVLAWLSVRHVHAVLVDMAGRTLVARSQTIAAGIERVTVEATTAARTLAQAVEEAAAGDAAALGARLARDVLVAGPRFLATAVALVDDAPTTGPAGPDASGTRWIRSDGPDATIAAEASDGGTIAASRARHLDPTRPDKTLVAEPRLIGGRLVVEHVHPVVREERFAGAASVERSIADLEAELQRVLEREAPFATGSLGAGVPAGDILVFSSSGRVLASTATDARPDGDPRGTLAETLGQLDLSPGTFVSIVDADHGGRRLVASARSETAQWEVVSVFPERAILAPARASLFRLAALAALVFAALLGFLAWLATRFTRRVDQATAMARRVAAGDLTGQLDTRGGDESGQLLRDIGRMTGSLRGLVSEVKRAGHELDDTTRSLSAAGERQRQAIQSLGSSTSQAAVASRQIAVTGHELLGTMNEVATVAAETAQVASAGRTDIAGIGETMTRLEESTAEFTERLALIRERAEDINMVITTITKVADQTNLLSINAAIEAEKAGEYGQGFIVVAREIRRLADQTAVATLDIERLVAQMQDAVSAGVEEMDRFATDVKTGVGRVSAISGQFVEVIDKVHGLSTRFEYVNQGMHAQATGAQQITEALLTLSDGTRSTTETLRDFEEAARHMVHAVEGLTNAVSRFRVEGEGGDDRPASFVTPPRGVTMAPTPPAGVRLDETGA